MRYDTARKILAEAIEQIDEGRNSYAQRSASLIGRMGGSPEEVRQGITGKRNPAAKSGRALLTKAHKAAEKKREKDPYYPYGKAESRRMSRYMAEAKPPEDMTPYHPDNTDPRVSPSSKPYYGRPDRGPKPMPIPRPGSGNKPSWVRPLGPTDPDWHYGLPNYPFPPDLSGSGGRPNSVANRTRTTK